MCIIKCVIAIIFGEKYLIFWKKSRGANTFGHDCISDPQTPNSQENSWWERKKGIADSQYPE